MDAPTATACKRVSPAARRVSQVFDSSGRSERAAMKIVVIGGSGLIGKKVVMNLRHQGHEAIAASPSLGVNTVTGEGLAQALAGARVVVDVANAPSWEDNAVLAFFETSGRNLLAAEAAASVGHHVALSVVGTDRLLASGYFRAKMAQEKLIKASPIPYTIMRATQFFEFVGGIAQSATEGQTVRLPPVLMQPIASDDVAAVMTDVALAEPLNGTFDLAGPEPIRQDDLVRQFLNATGDARTVITDPKALGFASQGFERQSAYLLYELLRHRFELSQERRGLVEPATRGDIFQLRCHGPGCGGERRHHSTQLVGGLAQPRGVPVPHRVPDGR